jgi:D-aspartate ligase
VSAADQTPPALIFGSGITALGVMRILGRRGIPAYLVSTDSEFVSDSRWFNPAPAFVPGMALDQYLAGLPFPVAVPIPCSDHWALQLAGLSGPLAQRFPTSLSPVSVIEQLLDKGRFAKALERAKVPHPLTVFLDGPDALAAVPESAFALAFLKPRDSQAFFARYGVKGFWVRSRAEAAARLEELEREKLAVLFQEYVPGPANHHYLIDGFVDRGGRVTATLARRRLRMYPVDFGNSSFMVSVARADAAPAIESVTRLLTGMSYRGVFSAEFKVDERDGVFKILEVNARPWWYVEFAARCGVDVVALAYDDALGRPSSQVGEYAVGKRLVYPYYDYFACRELVRRGQLTLGAWVHDWIGAWQPVFEWDDPMPVVGALWKMATRRWSRA